MKKARIALAISILENIPEGKFDLNFWAAVHGELPKPQPHCLSAGCALGWVASDPRAQKMGLYLSRNDITVAESDVEDLSRLSEDVQNQPTATPYYVPPSGRGYADLGYGAAEGFFGFQGYETAQYLFSPRYYDEELHHDPSAVIERLALLYAMGENAFLDVAQDEAAHRVLGIVN
jgi:hypothetical protein